MFYGPGSEFADLFADVRSDNDVDSGCLLDLTWEGCTNDAERRPGGAF